MGLHVVCSMCQRGWHDMCKKKIKLRAKTVEVVLRCECGICRSDRLA